MADQSMDTTKVQHCEPMNFIVLINKNIWGRLFRGTEMTQSSITQPHLIIDNSSWKLETGVYYTTWRQTIQQIWEYPFQVAQVVWSYSSHLGWSLPLSGSSSCLGIIWEAHLSQSVFKQFLHLTHAGGGPNESGHFQRLSQFILSSCPKLNELPHSMEHFTSL